MSKKISSILIALTLVLGFTFAAKAEVQNVRVGGDILVQGIWENNVDLIGETGSSGEPNVTNLIYSSARVYVSADLTDNVNAYVRFVNDRIWGTQPVRDYDVYTYWRDYNYIDYDYEVLGPQVEMDLAYITLAEMFGYPVSLTIGRQELQYGEGFLVGDGVNDIYLIVDTSPIAYLYGPRKAFDAIKFSSKYENSTIDIIKAKISEGYSQGTDYDLYGINWNLATDSYGTWDFAVFTSQQDDSGIKGKDMTTAISIRGEGDIPQVTVGKLHVKGEVVKETGKVEGGEPDGDEANLDAWGGYLGVNYTFDNPYEPYIGLTYTRLTGDKANTDKIEAFDPMFADEKYGEIADYVLYAGRPTNAKIAQASVGVKPNEKLAVDLDYYVFEADQAATAAITGISPLYIKGEADNRALGTEWDLRVTYDYTEDIQFGLCYAVFNPGKQIKDYWDYSDIDTTQAKALIGSVKVTF